MRKLADVLRAAEEDGLSLEHIFEQAKALPFEQFDCPQCKRDFMSRLECEDHIALEHPLRAVQRPLFCDVRTMFVQCQYCSAAMKLRACSLAHQRMRRCKA